MQHSRWTGWQRPSSRMWTSVPPPRDAVRASPRNITRSVSRDFRAPVSPANSTTAGEAPQPDTRTFRRRGSGGGTPLLIVEPGAANSRAAVQPMSITTSTRSPANSYVLQDAGTVAERRVNLTLGATSKARGRATGSRRTYVNLNTVNLHEGAALPSYERKAEPYLSFAKSTAEMSRPLRGSPLEGSPRELLSAGSPAVPLSQTSSVNVMPAADLLGDFKPAAPRYQRIMRARAAKTSHAGYRYYRAAAQKKGRDDDDRVAMVATGVASALKPLSRTKKAVAPEQRRKTSGHRAPAPMNAPFARSRHTSGPFEAFSPESRGAKADPPRTDKGPGEGGPSRGAESAEVDAGSSSPQDRRLGSARPGDIARSEAGDAFGYEPDSTSSIISRGFGWLFDESEQALVETLTPKDAHFNHFPAAADGKGKRKTAEGFSPKTFERILEQEGVVTDDSAGSGWTSGRLPVRTPWHELRKMRSQSAKVRGPLRRPPSRQKPPPLALNLGTLGAPLGARTESSSADDPHVDMGSRRIYQRMRNGAERRRNVGFRRGGTRARPTSAYV